MKRRELFLIALPRRRDHAVDARARRQQLFMQALEAFRHRIAAAGERDSHPAYFDDNRARELVLARRFGGGAGLLQRHAEDEMRVAVAGIAAHGFAQPVDRGAVGSLSIQ